MLSTIIQKLTRTSPDTTTNEAAELLSTCSLPDPSGLRQQRDAFEVQRQANEARSEAIKHDHRAFLEQQAIAERRPRLRAQIDALTAQIAAAEKGRAALVALHGLWADLDQQITQDAQGLYATALIASPEQRRASLDALDGLVRLRAKIAAALAGVSPRREFRRPSDPLVTFADDLRALADQIDRRRMPGMPRVSAPMPPGVQELIAALTTKGVPV